MRCRSDGFTFDELEVAEAWDVGTRELKNYGDEKVRSFAKYFPAKSLYQIESCKHALFVLLIILTEWLLACGDDRGKGSRGERGGSSIRRDSRR